MTPLQRNVRQARFRLGLNSWFEAIGWCLLGATVLWTLSLLTIKLIGLNWSVWWIGLGLLAAGVLVSIVWARLSRVDELRAATILDEAAQLNERTSTGLYCLGLEDPFARAATADAEAMNARLSVRSFIKYAWPSSLSFAAVAIVFGLGLSVLPIKPLRADQRELTNLTPQEQFERTQVQTVKRRLNQLTAEAEKNPYLQELKTQLKTIDQLPEEKLPTKRSERRELIKKLDSLADNIKRQHKGPQFDHMNELKKMFRGLKANKQPQTPADKLSQALAKGDFRSAQQALKDMKEQLAKMADQQDPQKKEQLKKQLDELAKQLSKAAQQEQRKEELQKELENSGVDKETAEKLVKNLTKENIEQAMKEMQKKDASKQRQKEMRKQMKQCRSAGQQGGSMAQAMQQAAQAMKNASMSDAAAKLDELADQLNSMEMLEQQLSELDATLSDLQNMKNDLAGDNPGQGNCPHCNGAGCSKCDGSGKEGQPGDGGMGRLGQGRGGRAPEEETGIRFVKERTPVHTTAGSLIAKMFVDGEQIKGDVSTEAVELISAAERDATDAINRNKIPNQYSDSVKKYFSDLVIEFKGETTDSADQDSAQTDATDSGNDSDSQ